MSAQQNSVEAVQSWLIEIVEMEAEEGCGHDEHGELLEEAGFTANDQAGQWLGPDGSGLEGIKTPGTEMKKALDTWLEGGDVPRGGICDALSEVAISRGAKPIDFQIPAPGTGQS